MTNCKSCQASTDARLAAVKKQYDEQQAAHEAAMAKKNAELERLREINKCATAYIVSDQNCCSAFEKQVLLKDWQAATAIKEGPDEKS